MNTDENPKCMRIQIQGCQIVVILDWLSINRFEAHVTDTPDACALVAGGESDFGISVEEELKKILGIAPDRVEFEGRWIW
ncbi:hypothetical protein [Acidithiobacillus caldus]|uniref:hypothetical protein n=1 Tax=Acidithiobacillus caldus TaxID=33059 RepID=UPI001C06A573|nr:hypothetical protein [Acidithiobacillus caldus]MBU2771598.1 hypothetical protein [Acidithiobacillus caldus]